MRHSAAQGLGFVIAGSHDRPPEGLYGDGIFQEGFACLCRLGLAFDA